MVVIASAIALTKYPPLRADVTPQPRARLLPSWRARAFYMP